MGIFDKLLSRASGPDTAAPDADIEEQSRLAGYKADALQKARETAAREKPARAPTLTDYFKAALTIPGLEGKAEEIADLSGQLLDGFLIRHEDIYPTVDQQKANMADAKGPSVEPGIGALRNFFDADGNGTIEPVEISSFYKKVQDNMRFDGTQFHNVTFQPATTLEIFNKAEGAQFANITLDGLKKDEVLTIGTMETGEGRPREIFRNVRLIKDEGGTITVAANATLNVLTVEGGNTVLIIASGAQVKQLSVKDEEISLNVQQNGQLFLPSFEGASFTPDSSMRGAVLRGNTMDDRFYGFKNCALNGMSFEKASLSGMIFDSTDLSGVSFKGARLADCVMKDTDLAKADFAGVSIHNLTIERGGQRIRVDTPEQLQDYVSKENAVNLALNIGRDARHAFKIPTAQEQHAEVATNLATHELRATAAAAVLNPAPMMTGDATQPGQTVSGGLTRIDGTPSETLTRVNGTSGNYQYAQVDANDVTLANQAALQTADAIAAERTANAMKDFLRDDGRGGGRSVA